MRMPPRKIFLSLAVLLTFFAVYLFLRSGGGYAEFIAVPGSKESFFSSGISLSNFFHILSSGLGYYFEKLVLPLNLNLLPQLPTSPIYYLIFLLPLILGGIFYWKGLRLEVLLLAWIVITLFPSLSILYAQMTPSPVAERYLYLPSAGFSIFLSLIILRMNFRKAYFILLALVVAFSIITFDRLKTWKNELALWEDTVTKNPTSVTARTNYGYSLLKDKNNDEARRQLFVALKQKRISFEQCSTILNLLGALEMEEKNYIQAEDYLLNALKADSKNITAYNNLGFLYMQMAESSDLKKNRRFLEKATFNFEKALKLSPGFLQPKYNMGLCCLKKEEFVKAREYFNAVIKSDPLSQLAKNSLQFLIFIQLQNK